LLRKVIACGEAAGFEWAFFTATAPLKALLERMSLPLVPLAAADRSRVPNPDAWGSYYALAPSVYAVHRDVVGARVSRDVGAAAHV
jgi:Thermostable hemolysin